MSETCARCGRRFGGHQAFRRAHAYGKCASETELRRRGLRCGPDGTWHRRANTDPGQMRLRLFGRGRPRNALPIFSVALLGGETCRVRLLGRGPGKRPIWRLLA